MKKEKKQSNFTNPDPWARIVGSRNTAAIYVNGVATTALFDTGAEIQLVRKQFCEDNEWEIQPIEKLTECSTVNGEIFGYEGFVEVNVQIPGRDFSEDHLFLVTSEISHQKEIPVVLGTYFANCFLLVFAVSGPFTSHLAVCICFSGFSRSEVCAFVWGIFVRGLRVETFVRVLRSSRCRL